MSRSGIVLLVVSLGFGIAALVQSQIGNDDCIAAESIATPSLTAGSTIGAGVSAEGSETCGTEQGSGGDVWYSVIGTGNTMTASTCPDDGNGSTDYDTRITVFCDDCADLTCVAGNDDRPGCSTPFASTVSWPSEAGAEYSIMVHGFASDNGNFDMDVFDSGPPGSHPVSCAVPVPLIPTPLLLVMAFLMAALGVWRVIVSRRGLGSTMSVALVTLLLVLPVAAVAQGQETVTAESGATYTVTKGVDSYEVDDSGGTFVGSVDPLGGGEYEAFDADGGSLGTASSIEDAIDLIDESLS